jgi:hypothetical protein
MAAGTPAQGGPPVGQNRAQDSFEAREAVGGRSRENSPSDSLRPIAGHVAAKPRHPNAAFGDRPGIGLGK